MRVSFDWDSTLALPRQKRLAFFHKASGHDLWIHTTRLPNDNNINIFATANDLGIPNERIIFTSCEDKWPFLKENHIDLHYDDDSMEIEEIEKHYPECIGILIRPY